MPSQMKSGWSSSGGRWSSQNLSTCALAVPRSAIVVSSVRERVEHLAADHELLHLRGALVDAECAYLAIEPFHGVAGHHAAPPEELHRVVYHALCRLRGEHLRHRRLSRDPRRTLVAR